MVGNATMKALGIQKYISRSESNISYEEASKLRYHFICIPTNLDSMNRYDIEPIRAYIKQIVGYRSGQNIFIIRSTILPGTLRALKESVGTEALVHMPEFLTEATWEQDSEHPDIVVVGSDRKNYRDAVVSLLQNRYRGVDIIETDSVTAEMIKCARNAFYATKVIFANEIYDLSEKLGANYTTVRDALYQSKWIGKNHLDVFHGGYRGAGGKCLKKDLRALAEFSQSDLLLVTDKINKKYVG